MAVVAPERDLMEHARATLGVFVTLAGVACGLTMLYMGMRSVMAIGGFCAEGGPFVIEQHCPKGVPGLVMGGIWGGIIFYGLYIWQTIKHHVPSFALLGWSALFLSLGWNFLEFGLHPPGPNDGLEWGWLTCAIVFGLMGGLPLLGIAKPTLKGFFGDREEQSGGIFATTFGSTASIVRQTVSRTPTSPTVSASSTTPTATTPTPTTSTTFSPLSAPKPAAPSSTLVSELERLAEMHKSGALSDAEFQAAKAKVISEES